eukprot:m.41551 g.41551  ORF g.41551 m.41551 type:complete len:759 (-) comp11466_c0_seq1:282-2558(-)
MFTVVAALFTACVCLHSGASAVLQTEVGADGQVTLFVNGKAWLQSDTTAVTIGSQKLEAKGGSLTLAGHTSSLGSDSLGKFNRSEFQWSVKSSNDVVFVTAVRDYVALDTVVFEQHFPAGIEAIKSTDQLASDFPSFVSAPSIDLQTVSFTGKFLGDIQAKPFAKCATGEQGGAVVLFDEGTLTSIAVSQLTSIKTADMWCTGHLSMGVTGTLTSVPPGFSASWILTAGKGIKKTMEQWGDQLRTFMGTTPADVYGDVIRSTLGFWTDNGGSFHYPPFQTAGEYQTKLLQAKADWEKQGIPIRHWQGDSWWYPKGKGGTQSSQHGDGMYRWVADPFVFPQGMPAFQQAMGLPFILHNRWFSPQNWYRANGIAGGADGWTSDTHSAVLPRDFESFYEYFFKQQEGFGLVTYEQDFLFTQYDAVPDMKTNATFADAWQAGMANQAAKANLTMQYCMPYARDYIASAQFSNIVTIRASGDYDPKTDSNWRIQRQSLMAHASGVLPFKDTFLSNNAAEPGYAPRADGPEPTPELQTLVALLSGSTVGPGDAPGLLNATRLLRTCRSDGLLLKADRASVSLDVVFTAKSPGNELGFTFATAADGSASASYVLAGDLTQAYDVHPAELELDEAASYVAVNWYDRSSAVKVDAQTPLTVATTTSPDTVSSKAVKFAFWVVAQVRSNWAVLGDMDKYVSLSSRRVAAVTDSRSAGDSADSVTVDLIGAPGEVLSSICAVHQTDLSHVVCHTVTLGADGKGSVTFSS